MPRGLEPPRSERTPLPAPGLPPSVSGALPSPASLLHSLGAQPTCCQVASQNGRQDLNLPPLPGDLLGSARPAQVSPPGQTGGLRGAAPSPHSPDGPRSADGRGVVLWLSGW